MESKAKKQDAATERPQRPVPSNREKVEHVKVEGYPNNVEATGPGHYEVDGSKMKFVKG